MSVYTIVATAWAGSRDITNGGMFEDLGKLLGLVAQISGMVEHLHDPRFDTWLADTKRLLAPIPIMPFSPDPKVDGKGEEAPHG